MITLAAIPFVTYQTLALSIHLGRSADERYTPRYILCIRRVHRPVTISYTEDQQEYMYHLQWTQTAAIFLRNCRLLRESFQNLASHRRHARDWHIDTGIDDAPQYWS